MLAIWSLVPLPFLKPAWTSGSSRFTYCWSLAWRIRVFQMSQLFISGRQSIGASASTSVLPMNTQDWSPLEWTGWISLQSKGLSRVFSNTTVQKHQFFGAQLSSQSNSYIHPEASKRTKLIEVMEFQLNYFKSWKMMLWKCCIQYASKFGKFSSGHRTGKRQFSFQSQRKAMPKNAQITAQLHSSHTLVK